VVQKDVVIVMSIFFCQEIRCPCCGTQLRIKRKSKIR